MTSGFLGYQKKISNPPGELFEYVSPLGQETFFGGIFSALWHIVAKIPTNIFKDTYYILLALHSAEFLKKNIYYIALALNSAAFWWPKRSVVRRPSVFHF